ncbi:hypothetical protein [Halorubrum vacuolatum]|uniref:Uncharacterized protein n=1 Tax=Halorubrum vacuolatum TaxID=63740 RepID=A0A238XBD4_HALVU|nr:hypothetical protein [Halorubrum vacuolatum]SNR56267.1 hypothetical protein SAMN06264855_11575 [Halorubrum vacuolatum]
MKRRHYLSMGSACAIGGVAGCLSIFESDVQLAAVSVVNEYEEEQTLEIRVLDDGTEVQHSELDLDADDDPRRLRSERVDCVWSSEARPYTVEANIDDEWKPFDVAAEAKTDCVSVRLHLVSPTSYFWSTYPCEDVDESDSEYVCDFIDID